MSFVSFPRWNLKEILKQVFCDRYDSSRGTFMSLARWNHYEIFLKVFSDGYDFSRGTLVRLARWNHCGISLNVSQRWLCFLTANFSETCSVKSLWDFLKCITVITLFSHGGLLWESLCEITARFFEKSLGDRYDFSWRTYVWLARLLHREIFR